MSDRGSAILAAVAGVLAFAWIGLEVVAQSRGEIAAVAGEADRARLRAAADAGVAIAVRALGADDPSRRWSLDGRAHPAEFAGYGLTIRVEDERGKVPINRLDESEVRRLFAAAGVDGERLDGLVDAFQDWQDDDDERRDNGAEAPDYAGQGIKPRNGSLRSLDELMALPGMDAALMARLRPALTVYFGESGGFDADTATPLAISVMSPAGQDDPKALERERELNGERTDIELAETKNLVGRPVTIDVLAADGRGGRLERRVIVELTGSAKRPFWIRAVG